MPKLLLKGYIWGSLIFGQPYTICSHTPIEHFITNYTQGDGFGSQFQAIIATVVYAELTQQQYAYTPFQAMEHNYDNDPEFIVKKEALINFMTNFEIIDGADKSKNYMSLPYWEAKVFFDKNITQCAGSAALKKIRKIFSANKNIRQYFDDQHLNIAVHVRRHNSHDNRTDGTNTPDTIFLNIIKHLRTIYKSKQPLFHIYSQGAIKDFKLFTAPDIILHLNQSAEDTFTPMVLADVLVTSPSSLSYTAALLSEGIVYYTPFWHQPLPHWIPINKL